jgi:3-phenylpropionate/trans-cinnamate dioxygenase ferredoxin subunit
MTTYVDAGPADIAPGHCLLRDVSGRAVLVGRAGDGSLFAIDGICSHAMLPMDGAKVRGDWIICPHHGARFCVSTGRMFGPPASMDLASFPAREAGDRVEVMLG